MKHTVKTVIHHVYMYDISFFIQGKRMKHTVQTLIHQMYMYDMYDRYITTLSS